MRLSYYIACYTVVLMFYILYIQEFRFNVEHNICDYEVHGKYKRLLLYISNCI